MNICGENFILQTSVDYDLPEFAVREVFRVSSNLVDFYDRLELELGIHHGK